MINLDSIPITVSEVIGRELDGEAVLVLPNQAQVKVINPTGALIWASIDGSRRIGEIAKRLCQEYEVESAEAEQDCLEFIEDLVNRGLVQII